MGLHLLSPPNTFHYQTEKSPSKVQISPRTFHAAEWDEFARAQPALIHTEEQQTAGPRLDVAAKAAPCLAGLSRDQPGAGNPPAIAPRWEKCACSYHAVPSGKGLELGRAKQSPGRVAQGISLPCNESCCWAGAEPAKMRLPSSCHRWGWGFCRGK